MTENSKIQWTDHTFNPWRGCTKVAQGCANCYAESMSKRNPKTLGVWGDDGTRVVASEAYWRQPLRWAREWRRANDLYREVLEMAGRPVEDIGRQRVFCASLADVFEDRPELVEPRARLIDTIQRTPELDYLLLTKRPENVSRLWAEAADDWIASETDADEPFSRDPDDLSLPLPNVWLGTSISTQEDADRNIPLLLQVPAAVRFVSAEPLLGAVDLHYWLRSNCPEEPNALSWLIIGGESGPKARPCDVGWVRSLVEQGQAAGVPVFVKQLGANPFTAVEYVDTEYDSCGYPVPVRYLERERFGPFSDSKAGDPSEWPEDLRVREWPRQEPRT